MVEKKITGPMQSLGAWMVKGNARALVLHSKDHTIASIPLGYAVVAGIALLLTASPLVVVALLTLYAGGGSLAIEDPAPTAQLRAVAVTSWQPVRRRRIYERAGR
jgi:hypothetical protein